MLCPSKHYNFQQEMDSQLDHVAVMHVSNIFYPKQKGCNDGFLLKMSSYDSAQNHSTWVRPDSVPVKCWLYMSTCWRHKKYFHLPGY